MSLTPPSESSAFGSQNFNVSGTASSYSSFLTVGQVTAPSGVLQIGPFAFDYEDTNDVLLDSEITDHWLEDNTAVHDAIGIKPVIITLRGRVAELVYSKALSGQITALLTTVESGLSQADAYLGKYTPGATDAILNAISQVQNVLVQVEQASARVAQIMNLINGQPPGRNNQQKAFATLSALQQARVLFSVYTPFQLFNNMAILSVQATQPKDTRTASDFTVKMKQLQLVSSLDSPGAFAANYSGNSQFSNQPQSSNGFTTGVQTAVSAISSEFTPLINAGNAANGG